MTTIEKQILGALSDVEHTDLNRISSTDASCSMRAVCNYELVRRAHSKTETPNPPLKHGIESAQDFMRSYNQEIQALRSIIEKQHRAIDTQNLERSEMLKERGAAKAKRWELENTIAELRAELHRCACASVDAKLQNFVGKSSFDLAGSCAVVKLEATINVLKQERDQARSAINVLKTERDELKNTIAGLHTELSAANREKTAEYDRARAILSNNSKLSDRVNELLIERAEWRNRYEVLDQRLSTYSRYR